MADPKIFRGGAKQVEDRSGRKSPQKPKQNVTLVGFRCALCSISRDVTGLSQ